MKKKTLSFVMFLVLSLVVLGCNNNEQPKQNSNETKKTSNETIEKIKTRGKLIVGTETGFAPFAFVEEGKIVGYEPDIINEIAKNLGVEVEYFDTPFSGLLTSLDAKKFDFVVSGITATSERRERYGMTVPTAEDGMAVLKRKDDDSIKTPADLSGKTVAVAVNGVSEETAREYDKQLKSAGKEGLKEIKVYQQLPEAHMDLKNGRVDAVVQSLPTLYTVVKGQPDVYEIVGTIGDELFMAFAVRKDDKEFLQFLNSEILKMKENGKLAELQKKWFDATWNLPDKFPDEK